MVLDEESLQLITQILNKKMGLHFPENDETFRKELNFSCTRLEHSIARLKKSTLTLEHSATKLEDHIAQVIIRLLVNERNLNSQEFEHFLSDISKMISSIDLVNAVISEHNRQLQKFEFS